MQLIFITLELCFLIHSLKNLTRETTWNIVLPYPDFIFRIDIKIYCFNFRGRSFRAIWGFAQCSFLEGTTNAQQLYFVLLQLRRRVKPCEIHYRYHTYKGSGKQQKKKSKLLDEKNITKFYVLRTVWNTVLPPIK